MVKTYYLSFFNHSRNNLYFHWLTSFVPNTIFEHPVNKLIHNLWVQRLPLIPSKVIRRRLVPPTRIVPLMIIHIMKSLIICNYRINYFYTHRKKFNVELVRECHSYNYCHTSDSDCIILFKKHFDTNLFTKHNRKIRNPKYVPFKIIFHYFTRHTKKKKKLCGLAHYIITEFGLLRQQFTAKKKPLWQFFLFCRKLYKI